MTLEEFKHLSVEEFDEFRNENEEEYEELMSAAFAEADEQHHGKVFEADCAYFITTGDSVREISTDAGCSPRGGWFPEIITGPSEEEIEAVKSIMNEYDFDEDLFSEISEFPDDEDWDSEETISYYLDEFDIYEDEDEDEEYDEDERQEFEEKIRKVRIVEKLQQLVNEDDYPINSVEDIYNIIKRIDLEPGVLYYEWEDDYIDFYDNINECGEGRGTYEDIDDYDWLCMLQHLEDYEVTA